MIAEPSSLLAKVRITKDKLKQYLLSTPQVHTVTPEWEAWWDSRQMTDKALLTNKDFYQQCDHVYELVKSWLEYEDSHTETHYDLKSETWYFSAYFFADNYYAMVNTLAVLSDIAAYRSGDRSDFIMVYPYHWGSSSEMPQSVQAYIKFNGNKSHFVFGEVDPADFKTAGKYLKSRSHVVEESYAF